MSIDKKDFFVAGIGASAGGLDAIQQLFDNIPNNTGMAFVVVQHLSPDFKSLMPELLAKHTTMSIFTAEDNQIIQQNCIYLNKEDKNLTVEGGKLHLVDRGSKNKLNLPINEFFDSLGSEYKEKSIGIVLSGTGSDGSKGIKTIKEAGGTIIVQDPETAQFDGMINSAVQTNTVDFVLPPKGIGEMLVSISGNRIAIDEGGESVRSDQAIFTEILEVIYKYSGIDFKEYKKTTLLRRVENRMNVCNVKDINDFLEMVKKDDNEKEALKEDFLIGVTSFFRDADMFDIMKNDIIPTICKNHANGEPVRIWIPGCSTGQEAVSIAILFDEYIRVNKLSLDFKIFATDVQTVSLATAGNGVYGMSEESEIGKYYMDNYFIATGQSLKIIKRIRDKIVYSNHNLLKDPPFIRMDLISCRNLLIYLENRIQNRIMMNFQFALNTYGFLVLGASESIGETGRFFRTIDGKWKIYQNTSDTKNVPIQVNTGDRIQSYVYKNSAMGRNFALHDYKMTDNPEAVFYKFLSKAYSPSVIFTDVDYNILFVSGDAGKRLIISEGMFNNNLLKSVQPEIVSIIRNGIRRASASDNAVIIKDILVKRENESYVFDLTFQKLTGHGFPGVIYSITFGEEVPRMELNAEVIKSSTLDESSKLRIEDLENELKGTRSEMQNLIEELETSNEEMQSSNEELMASNEELQSTNEELQSVNEELYTVNSELQEKNRELQYLNDDMNNLMNCTEIGTLFLNNELKIRKFTPALTRHFNLQEGDIGRPISSFTSGFDEKTRETIINDSKRVIDKLTTVENEISDKDGNSYLERINPYISSDKKIEGVVISFVNTNNIKKAEKKLILSENKFRRMFEFSPVGKYTMDMGGKLSVNTAFCKMLGYKKDEINTWIEITYPDDVDMTRNMIKKLMESSESLKYKKRFVKNGGDFIWAEIRAVMQRDDQGMPLYILSSIIDISDNIRIESEVNRAKQDAEISNMHKNYFLANMSHELRTPLNSVIGFSDLLKDDDVTLEESKQYIKIINDNANHLLSLINDIIDVAKIEADELKLDKKDFNVTSLMNDIVKEFDNYKLVNNKAGVKIKMVVPDGLETMMLHSDRERLRQVFTNLLGNALKFSPEKSTITLGFETSEKFIEFYVADQGIGIAKEQLEEIFGRFNQVNYSTNSPYGGTGLGLTICRGIVNGLGGRIWAESELGKGSTFKFTLPLDNISCDEVEEERNTNDTKFNNIFEGKNILIADDDSSIRLYFEKILEQTKAKVYFAKDGIEAVDMYRNIPNIDIVLMDIQMPMMNGLDAFHQIMKYNPNVKVIAQTAFAMQEEKLKYIRSGFVSYLAKPIKRDALFLELSKYI
jgi:two-component system CheB/CheR fusion protein